jgi:hypothetical protein
MSGSSEIITRKGLSIWTDVRVEVLEVEKL